MAGVLLLAAGCAGGTIAPAPTVTVTVTPTPSVSFDEQGRRACDAAAQDAWLAALAIAKLSSITELQDLALREEQLGNHELIKQWCARNYHNS
jgi:hypothetical protein